MELLLEGFGLWCLIHLIANLSLSALKGHMLSGGGWGFLTHMPRAYFALCRYRSGFLLSWVGFFRLMPQAHFIIRFHRS